MPDTLTPTFAALADPTRRAMLLRLSQGEANVSDLARPFLREMSLPAVTKHLQVLEKAGLITKTRKAQTRPCKLNPGALKHVADWIEQYRAFWEESLDRLGDYLKTVTAEKRSAEKRTAERNAAEKSAGGKAAAQQLTSARTAPKKKPSPKKQPGKRHAR